MRLGLLGVSAFLLLFPLTLGKPGVPTHLKADEAAYFGMAMSLAHDRDLTFGPGDVDRFFTAFPYQPVNNLILMSADGWRTVAYAKPYVYSLFAAPFAALFGADGILFFNSLLLVAMLWMGVAYLRRYNEAGVAALYAAGFFLLSVGFVYVYWLQPEVFNMAAVAACLFFGLPREGAETGLPRPRRDVLYAVFSGVALALVVYNKPMLALIGAAPLVAWARERRWRPLLAWSAGAAACLALLAGGSFALTGTPTSYLGVQRGGFTLCGPGQMPAVPRPASGETATASATAAGRAGASPAPTPDPASSKGLDLVRPAGTATAAPASGAAAAVAASPTGNSYRWLFRVPDTSWSELAANIGYFLWGRHTGLLLYMPFAALSVLLFLLHGRRALERWALLGSIAAIALFFLLLIAWNWQGGGGFVGNRYFVNVYPAFLFLVTSVRPRALLPLGYAVAGLFLSPLVLAPFGLPGPEPTLQMHVRSVPFRWFPFELTLRNVPGYHRVPIDDFRAIGRRDVFLPRGETFWLHGSTPVELYLVADRPLGALAWNVGSLAPHNRIELKLGHWRDAFELGADETRRVVVPAQQPTRRWTIKDGTLYAYRLLVRASEGRPQVWERELPPVACPGWPWQPKEPDSFFVGATLTYLGAPEGLDADVYTAVWSEVDSPSRVRAGEPFTVRGKLRNGSRATWRSSGGARVRLAYHWLDARGNVVVREGERTDLPRPIAPGEALRVEQRVLAPPRPGLYLLDLDPVFESVAWFSERGGKKLARVRVEVLPPAHAAPAPTPTVGPR